MLSDIYEMFLNVILPPYCCGCGKLGQLLCPNCYEQIEFYPQPLKLKLANSQLDSMTVACHYQPPVTNLIHALKYQSVKNIAPLFGQLIFHTVNLPVTTVITSVPLHKDRFRERGFNQAELIAKKLATLANCHYYPLLVRTKKTPPQASINNRHQRLTQLHNIFEFDQRHQKLVTNQTTILIVDDVITTGATLNECAQTLKKAGFQTIYGLALAHGK